MSTSHTTIMEAASRDFETHEYIDLHDYSELEAVRDFLRNKDTFRPFHEGLTELLRRIDFEEINDPVAKTAFLMERLRSIGSTLEKKTVADWVSGKRRPKVENGSRERMYELCFALDLSLDDVNWFFGHVYFDRCFNYRTINEAVYFYCFKNRLSYATAKDLIQKINSFPAQAEKTSLYTEEIKMRLEHISSEEQLVEVLGSHRDSFSVWNQTIAANIRELRDQLLGNEESKRTFASLKKEWERYAYTLNNPKSDPTKEYLEKRKKALETSYETQKDIIKNCGLLVHYLCIRESVDEGPEANFSRLMLDLFSNEEPFSDAFLLRTLLTTDSGIAKNTVVPDIIKNNFPSKKTFSDILDEVKVGTSKSYDALRKVLLLLKYHVYWYQIYISSSDKKNYSSEEAFERWHDETNALLTECGYQDLSAVNPYDLIFLIAGHTNVPLAFFNELIGELIDEE